MPVLCPLFSDSFPLQVIQFSSVQFSRSVVSDSLQSHELQHARLPCASLFAGVCSDSCTLSWCCYLTISSSVVPFSSCLQSFPASEAFLVSQFLASGGQSIGTSASASVIPMLFRTDFLYDGLVGSPCSPRDSQEFSPTPQFKSTILQHSSFFMVQLSRPYITTGKNNSFDYMDLCW